MICKHRRSPRWRPPLPLPRAWGFLCTHLGKPAIMPVLACFIPLPAPSARQRGAFPGAGSFRLEWLPRSNDEAANRALPQSAPDLRQGLIPRSEGQVRGEDPSSISTNRPEPPIFARRAAGAGGIRTGGPTLFLWWIRLRGLTRLLRGAQQRIHRAQRQNSSLPARGWSNHRGSHPGFRDCGGRFENTDGIALVRHRCIRRRSASRPSGVNIAAISTALGRRWRLS